MKEWFNALAQREQVMVGLAGVVVAFAILYLALWEPLNKGVTHMDQRVSQQKQLVRWLNATAPEIRALRSTKHRSKPEGQNDSLLTVIDKTSKTAGMSGVVKRIQPQGENSVQVWIEGATFNDMLDWLHRLQDRFAISIHSVSLKPAKREGQVDGHIRLTRSSAPSRSTRSSGS